MCFSLKQLRCRDPALPLLNGTGFLRAGEFTVPSADAYDPASHLSLSDVALDSHTNPSMDRLVLQQRGFQITLPEVFKSLCQHF